MPHIQATLIKARYRKEFAFYIFAHAPNCVRRDSQKIAAFKRIIHFRHIISMNKP